MYTITVRMHDGTSLKRALKDGASIVVGRSSRASDMAIETDPAISSKHLRISSEGGQLFIEDLGSTNGTFIERGNSETLEQLQPGERIPLQPGQAVSIGESDLKVEPEFSFDRTLTGTPAYQPVFRASLYTDIVGSTAKNRELGDLRSFNLEDWMKKEFRARFKRFGGRVQKDTGDGFEVVFDSVHNALSCAASCQRELRRRNEANPGGVQLDVRMGVNGGEALRRGKGVFGRPLIIAARVMAQADGGQILVPEHVLGVVAGSLWRFSPVGERDLKGVGRVPLYEVDWIKDPNLDEVARDGAAALNQSEITPAKPGIRATESLT